MDTLLIFAICVFYSLFKVYFYGVIHSPPASSHNPSYWLSHIPTYPLVGPHQRVFLEIQCDVSFYIFVWPVA